MTAALQHLLTYTGDMQSNSWMMTQLLKINSRLNANTEAQFLRI